MVGVSGSVLLLKTNASSGVLLIKLNSYSAKKRCIILFKQKTEKRIGFYDEFKAQRVVYTIGYRLLKELTIIATQITFNVDGVVFVKIHQYIK